MEIFRYPDGMGWLILSGGHTTGSPIRAHTIERAGKDGDTAYISFAEDTGDTLLEDMQDLGAQAGFIIDMRDDNATIRKQLEEAGIVVVESGDSLDDMYSILLDGLADALLYAYQKGATVLLEGRVAALFGKWYLGDDGQVADGFGWVEDTFILPGLTSIQQAPSVQNMLVIQPEAIALTVAAGSAFVIGTMKQVETWGEQKVTISLGSGYGA